MAMCSPTVTQCEEAPKKKIEESSHEPTLVPDNEPAKQAWVLHSAIGLPLLHIIAVYALITRYEQAMLYTWLYNFSYLFISGVGVTAGAHRLWAHRSYSAKLPLRIFLAIAFCMAGQTHMYKWIRDHRTHHKYTETTADPHDSNRGFFFSHIGWLMMKRHPNVLKYGRKIDMSDIEADPVIYWFDLHYNWTMSMLCFVIPTLIPVYFWNEKWDVAILATITRYVFMLNATFCVNSLAHMVGNKPYNKNFKASENAGVALFALGEGWHNYHHAFPWDYKAAELPAYGLNVSTAFIELMAKIGWAYDLKTPSKEIVAKISRNKGDGTVSTWGYDHRHLHHHRDADESDFEKSN